MLKEDMQKQPLKGKITEFYEIIFKNEDPTQANGSFWDEFFLLKPNFAFWEAKFNSISTQEIEEFRVVINSLFHQCVKIIKDTNHVRITNSLRTLSALIRGVYGKARSDYGFDNINLLIGFNSSEQIMQNLIEQLSEYLSNEYPPPLKASVLKFLLILVTATENVSQNTLLEYLMMHSLFDVLIKLLSDTKSRQNHGDDAVLLLTILINYRKYEAVNPYIVKLSIIDSEMSLNGYGLVISQALGEFNRKFCNGTGISNPNLWWSFSSLVGNMFVSEEEETDKLNIKENNTVLLGLYEILHLNRNFLITLTHCQVDNTALIALSSNKVGSDGANGLLKVKNELPPSNLLVTFLEFSSIIMLNTKDDSNINTCKLCFIILKCISEDQYANSIIHDVNLVYKVQLHKMPMRHRRVSPDSNLPYRPLACPLLDLMVEFILSHMTKNLSFELYYLCLGIVHRILCYQKKGRVRLQYNWKELWAALISLLKFLGSQEVLLSKNCDILLLSRKVVNTLNLFITFGDTFLHSPLCYDELYYELVRMSSVFDSLYSLTLRHTGSDSEFKEYASKLIKSLVNVRAITNHFSPKIEGVMTEKGLSQLTEEQVFEIVKAHYDSLTLKLYDNLDHYEKYTEKPIQAGFFTPLVRSIIAEYQAATTLKSLEKMKVLKDYYTIY